MEPVNAYTIRHIGVWTLLALHPRCDWRFLVAASAGWEILELALPFAFAHEVLANKAADVLANGLGFLTGKLIHHHLNPDAEGDRHRRGDN